MKETYLKIDLYIPNNIDYEKLFSKLDFFIKKHKKSNTNEGREKIKQSVYLFLHYLYPTHFYLEKYKKNSYFKPILSKEFNSITRNLQEITIDILCDSEYPVIDINSSYKVGKYPKSYKLKYDFFLFCKSKKISIQSIISDNYGKKLQENHIKSQEISSDFLMNSDCSEYQYLFKNFDSKIITIDEKGVNKLIDEIEKKLLKKQSKCRNEEIKKLSLESISNKIIRMRRCVILIKNGEFNGSINSGNNRLYSVITGCNREIRRFIKINGNKVNEVDVINSHLYTLSNILNKKFYDKKNKLSLYNIDKILYDKLSTNLFSYSNISLKLYNDKRNITQYNKSIIPYICGSILNKKDVQQYISLPFSIGVYECLNTLLFNDSKDREYIKRNVMNFLNLQNFRDNNQFILGMRKKFPHVDEVIKIINGVDFTKGWLSILLQRIESYLLLDVGTKSIIEKIPNINFLTVHDSILVEEKYDQNVKEILEKSISKETGIDVGLKIKSFEDPLEDINNLVEEKWSDIQKSVRNTRNKIKKRT